MYISIYIYRYMRIYTYTLWCRHRIAVSTSQCMHIHWYISIYIYRYTSIHIYRYVRNTASRTLLCRALQYRHCSVDIMLTHCSTGWRRPIGCLKLQVLFRKRATNCRALLRKMTCKDKASYGSSPPCIEICSIDILQYRHCSIIIMSTHCSMGWLWLVGSIKL